MDTAAFAVTLLVVLAVGYWYVENEVRASDGAHGLFAVRQAEKPRRARGARYTDSADRVRYRPREKSAATPAPGADGLTPDAAPKYRRKERAWDRAAKPGAED